jgi:hypothetical protein
MISASKGKLRYSSPHDQAGAWRAELETACRQATFSSQPINGDGDDDDDDD